MIILGIDPGTATTGYGVIKKGPKDQIECIGYGVVETSPTLAPEKRLLIIHKEINKLIGKYHPNVMAIEKVFFFKNLKTVMPVSQAKGVIMLTAEKKKLPIYEFTPLQVKTATTGYGRATKKQIQEMVKRLLELEKIPKPDDAADALAVALCYCNCL